MERPRGGPSHLGTGPWAVGRFKNPIGRGPKLDVGVPFLLPLNIASSFWGPDLPLGYIPSFGSLVFHCGQDLTNEPSDSCVSQTIGRIRARPEADGNGLETTAQTMLKAYLCLDTLHG